MITRKFETGSGETVAGRNAGFQIGVTGDLDQDYEVTYLFEPKTTSTGRLTRITGPGLPAYGVEYARPADSNAAEYVRYKAQETGDPLAQIYRKYETDRDLLEYVENKAGSGLTVVSKYLYANDDTGRRTSVVYTGSAFDPDFHVDFAYNDRGELTTADRKTGIDPDQGSLLTTSPFAFDYTYDPIGNRITYNEDNSLTPTYYCTNELNQYRYTDDAADTCPTPSTPTESFHYDVDGNLTVDGQFAYTWDAENRLTLVQTRVELGSDPDDPDDGDKQIEFAYDYMGRRIRKTVSTYTSGQWVEDTDGDRFFVYDGWNVVMVLDANASNATLRKYTWGSDLSGTPGNAGGIGGLLAAVETQGTSSTTDDDAYWYFYDGNGNVGQVIAADGQSTVAKYEYDPYGKLIASSGTYADTNPFRFSTKWFDAETGMYYYGYRYYAPRLGRWLNRDPFGEKGGVGLYGFVGNNAQGRIDALGLWGYDIHHDLTQELAEMAGYACAADVAEGAQRPDEDERNAPEAFEAYLKCMAKSISFSRTAGPKCARERATLAKAAEWHFPVSSNGIVEPNSEVARSKARTGIKNCDFTLFTEGLHVLQDSWSHQGKPYIMGVGHYRGVKEVCRWVDPHTPFARRVCGLQRDDGTLNAATSHAADDASLWPADVRAAGMATYLMLLDFAGSCPCHCPGGRNTQNKAPMDPYDVGIYLKKEHSGDNLGE